jgi:hypothetical protein
MIIIFKKHYKNHKIYALIEIDALPMNSMVDLSPRLGRCCGAGKSPPLGVCGTFTTLITVPVAIIPIIPWRQGPLFNRHFYLHGTLQGRSRSLEK